MTARENARPPTREPAVLERLRSAVQATGLTVDITAPGGADRGLGGQEPFLSAA